VRSTCFQTLFPVKGLLTGFGGAAVFLGLVFHAGERSEPEWNTKLFTGWMRRLCLIVMIALRGFFSCQCKKMRPTLPAKEKSVACASSCNPWMTLSQSEAQPEPRTPCAPNSNRCQSGGYHRQLA
jgi:hypothetical protein